MTKVCIYKIVSPSGKIYIGRTVDYKKRIDRYRRLACPQQKILYNSLIKYDFKNHLISIIHELPQDVSNETINVYEELYIELYKNCGYSLMNLTIGGGGVRGIKYDESVKKKLSAAHLGKRLSEETKARMKRYAQNRPTSHNINAGLKRRLPVHQYTLCGKFIKEWPSLKSIPKEFGYVRGCLKGEQYQAGGFYWEYKHLKSENILDRIKELKIIREARNLERRKNISIFYKSTVKL